MAHFNKRAIGEWRIRKRAKDDTKRMFDHILENDILKIITQDNDNVSYTDNEDNNCQQSVFSELVHNNENEQVSLQVNDGNCENLFLRNNLQPIDESNDENDEENDENEEETMDVDDENEEDENEEDEMDEQMEFRLWLREWNMKHNISVRACRELFLKLKNFHPDLPSDPRTLNETSRVTLVKELNNGSYVHVGLIPGLERRLRNSGLKNFDRKEIGLDINIDGINVTKSCVTDV